MGFDDTWGIDVEIKFITEKALLVVVENGETWFPKSQVWCEKDDQDLNMESLEVGDKVKLTMPEWLAIEKELV